MTVMGSFKIQFLCVVVFLINLASSLVCDHEIFCHGRILHEVQMNSLYQDSKTYVDMKLKYSKDTVLKNFDTLLHLSDNKLSRAKLLAFVNENFDDVASEFEHWVPCDLSPEPKFLDEIFDRRLKAFAKSIHSMWVFLSRKIKEDVLLHSEQYSIIYLPEPFIVPGGRFREIYYWDTYWICKGLLLSEMYVTVKGMIKNYVHLIENYGLIPNGNRIYYINRSQPPMLIGMVEIYYEFTGDFEFVKEIFPTLEKEFEFWRVNRSVKVRKSGKEYTMFRYFEDSVGPRPESYKEDVVDATAFSTSEERENFFCEMKAAAESGWDFTSRWFVYNSTDNHGGELLDTKPRQIVPVDLNSVMERNARTMAKYCKEIGRRDKSRYYSRLSRDLKEAIKKVMWQEQTGAWLDYDFVNKKVRNKFYPSNLAPLWSRSYDRREAGYYSQRVLTYLITTGVTKYTAGIPASQVESGQQWDYPNTWAPLQDMIISGLYYTNQEEAMKVAVKLAQNWISTNYIAYEESKAMYEKYDARVVGMPGGGGEYENQIGFGWTNGVALDLMYRFGRELVAPRIRDTRAVYKESVVSVVEEETALEEHAGGPAGENCVIQGELCVRATDESLYLSPEDEASLRLEETQQGSRRPYEEFYERHHEAGGGHVASTRPGEQDELSE